MGTRFGRYVLRTIDVDRARSFYTAIFGDDFWGGDLEAFELHEQARQRGAPPHWLGLLAVNDVESTLAEFLKQGAEQLGPVRRDSHGLAIQANLKDPFGAIVALQSGIAPPEKSRVAWQVLHTRDQARASTFYASLFSWSKRGLVDVGPEHGGEHQMFAWDASGPMVGAVTNTARLPQVHTQWLFFFPVRDIEKSVAHVRELGGLALPIVQTTDGERFAGCDDPQGAAFGLYQRTA